MYSYRELFDCFNWYNSFIDIVFLKMVYMGCYLWNVDWKVIVRSF